MGAAKPAPGAMRKRPLSPHLEIYSMSSSMLMSILHRLTGAALYFGTLLLAWWLVAAAVSASYFEFANSIFGSWPGRVVIFGYTWAFFHHMMGGLRHFVWDLGAGHGKKEIDLLARTTLALSTLATAIVWVAVLSAATPGGQP
jgi:succinate dehydrogenase / fumarate reductase cytochrome b subunit